VAQKLSKKKMVEGAPSNPGNVTNETVSKAPLSSKKAKETADESRGRGKDH